MDLRAVDPYDEEEEDEKDDDDGGEWFELASFAPREDRLRSISYRSSERGSRRRHRGSSRRKKKSAWQKFKDLLRSFFAFVFSSVGICVLVNVYLFVGAYAFMALEGEAEKASAVRFEVEAERAGFVDRLWRVTDRLNTLHPGNWTEEVRAEVERFQGHIIARVGDGYAGKDVPTPKWTYSGSLLYTITVITTIGETEREAEREKERERESNPSPLSPLREFRKMS